MARKLTQEQNYDQAVIDWAHSLKYKDRPLPCVFSTPQRSFAQMRRMLEERNSNMKTIPLPFASIDKVADKYDPLRYNSGYMSCIAANPSFTKWYGMQYPLPFTFTYQIDIWARLFQDLNDLQTQLMLRHRANVIHLDVNHPSIPTPDLDDGPQQLSVSGLYRGSQEFSEKSPGSREERILRRSFTYDIEGWRTFEADEHEVVTKVVTHLYSSEDLTTEDDLLDTVEVMGYIE